MKKAFHPFAVLRCRQLRIFIILLLLAGIPSLQIAAQTDTTAKEEPSLLSPSIEFIGVQKGDNTIDLKALLKTKFKGGLIRLPFMKISFVQVTDSAEKELGFVITDKKGAAVFNIKEADANPGKDGSVHFKAMFAGNKSMEAAEEEVSFKRARLEITPVKGDSLNSVTVKLLDLGSGTAVPVDSVTVGVFVHRLFYPMKVGEGTIENGEASVEIPDKLPGDAKGNITLLAKLDEHEKYGKLEASTTQAWGVPVSDQLKELPRSLWSAHPPLWMIITFAILVTAVWGHYIVIIYELFRLRKEEPHPPANASNT
ncbi:MAG: hypothetical protein NTW29_09680 [Bacteroidetes bacterium]|nr:hypothetical protein [Bacteroidota bacterium]